jgi:hypothetical protein
LTGSSACFPLAKWEGIHLNSSNSYWAYEHRYGTDMISIREGGLVPQNTPQTEESPKDEQARLCDPQNCNSHSYPHPEPGSKTTAIAAAQFGDVITPEVHDVASPTQVEIAEQETSEEPTASWAKHQLCVIDPFIRVKASIALLIFC